MNIEQIAMQVMENVINDLMYAFEMDRQLAERMAGTVMRNPKMAVELETLVKQKKMLGS